MNVGIFRLSFTMFYVFFIPLQYQNRMIQSAVSDVFFHCTRFWFQFDRKTFFGKNWISYSLSCTSNCKRIDTPISMGVLGVFQASSAVLIDISSLGAASWPSITLPSECLFWRPLVAVDSRDAQRVFAPRPAYRCGHQSVRRETVGKSTRPGNRFCWQIILAAFF